MTSENESTPLGKLHLVMGARPVSLREQLQLQAVAALFPFWGSMRCNPNVRPKPCDHGFLMMRRISNTQVACCPPSGSAQIYLVNLIYSMKEA